VQLEQGNRVEETPRRLPGVIPGLGAAVPSVWLLWPEAYFSLRERRSAARDPYAF
jgi:hypothetical protein